MSASIGFSHSTSNSKLVEHLAHAGYWVAGNDVSIAAGNNVNIEGTVSQAGRCLSVAATNNLTIQSALSTIDQKTSFQSESASVGVSAGVGLTGFSLAGNASVGFQTGNSSLHQTTNVMSQLSGGAVTLKSGRDTTVAGATVTGGTVTADVGGNLSVESRQDTLTSRNSQTGFSLGIGIGLGSVSTTLPGPTSILGQTASFLPDGLTPNTNILSQTGTMLGNAGGFLASGSGPLTNVGGGTALHNSGSIGFTYVRGSEDKAWTNALTTISGTNGTTLNVTGNTNVKGAVIESSAGGPLNINTGTFTYQDIHDYDKTSNINASVNVTIPLGSFDWQKNAPGTSNGGAAPVNAPPPAQSMLAQIGQGLAQAGQYLGQYPTKVQVAYKATDKEGTTYATVGAGNINVSDTAKQAALEKDGKTGALDKLNRDVTKTQVVTKNTVEAFNFYFSTQAVSTIASITGKALIYLDDMVSKGLISADNAAKAKELIRRYENGEFSLRFTPCSSNSGWLRELIFPSAYAANGDGCVLREKGIDGLYTADGQHIDQETEDAIRISISSASANDIKTYIQQIEDLKGRGVESDSFRMVDAWRKLQTAMDTFDLCWDNTYSSKVDGMTGITSLRDLINQDLINHPNFYMPESRFQIADISKKGGDTVALLFSSLSPSDVAKVRELAATNPELYAGLANAVSIKAQVNGSPFALSTLSPEILRNLTFNTDLNSFFQANPELFTELVRGKGNGDGDLVNIAYLAAGLAKDYNNLSTSARAAAMTTIASYFSQVGWSNDARALGPQISPDANRRWLAEIDTIAFAFGHLPGDGRTAVAQTFDRLKFGNPVLDPESAMVLESLKAFNTELLVVGGGLSTFTTIVTAGTAPKLFAAGWAINDAIYAGRQYVTGEEITPGGLVFNGVVGGEAAVGMGFAYSLSPAAGNLVTRGFLGMATVQVGRELTDWSSMTAQERNGVIYDTVTLGVGYGFSRLGGVWGSTSADDAAAQTFKGATQPSSFAAAYEAQARGEPAPFNADAWRQKPFTDINPDTGLPVELPAKIDSGVPAIYGDLEVIGGGPSRGKIAPFNPQGLRDVCAYATCGHIASVLDGVNYADSEAISEAYSAKQLLRDQGFVVPDGTKTLMSLFGRNSDAIISGDGAMTQLFWDNGLSLRPLISANVDIANLAEGAYVIKIQGVAANPAGVIESHVQSLIVGLDAQVRTNGAFDRYIYDARDSTLITDFSIYQNGTNIRFYKATSTPDK